MKWDKVAVLSSLLLVTLTIVFALACGGGGGGGGGGGNGNGNGNGSGGAAVNEIDAVGTASKGPLDGAAVRFYVLNANGTRGKNARVSQKVPASTSRGPSIGGCIHLMIEGEL